MKKETMFACFLFFFLLFFPEQGFSQPGTDCQIKGIISSDGAKMYLIPGHYLYDQITPDEAKGERWFCSAEEAEELGFVFVPDPGKPQLRPSKSTPTPPPEPTATPKPEVREEPEPAAAEPTPKPEQPAEEPTAEPAPAEPTEEPAPVETPEPVVIAPSESTGPTDEPFEEPDSQVPASDEILEQLIQNLPVELQEQVRNLPVEELQQLVQQVLPGLIASWPIVLGISLFIFVVVIAIRWRIFAKAGRPGWVALIPVFHQFMMLNVAGIPWWLIIISFILFPLYAILWIIVRPFMIAKNFDKGFLYGLGLFLLPFIFWPLLAFSGAEYGG